MPHAAYTGTLAATPGKARKGAVEYGKPINRDRQVGLRGRPVMHLGALAGACRHAGVGRNVRTRKSPAGGGASQLDSAASGGERERESSQLTDTVKLPEATGEGSSSSSAPSSEKQPSPEGQASAEAPLSQEDPKPFAGEIRSDGLVYRVLGDGASVALVGWHGDTLAGDVSIPAAVSSGADSFAVTAVGAEGAGRGVFSGASVESVSIPASVSAIADGALSDCPTLSRVSVSSGNKAYSSFDGMLFSKDLSGLLLVPEGRKGVARIPDPAVSVPSGAFSRASGISGAVVGEGSASFSSRDGILYSKDMRTLVACPPGAAGAVVVPEGVESVGSKAFAGCDLSSITALGHVREIAAEAFDAETCATAVVALPAGDYYEARKAVWEAAGFVQFAEPARPGDVAVPEPSEGAQASGLAFEVLGDYTLAVSWQGPEEPQGELAMPASAEVGGVSYRVSAVADAAFAGCSGLTGVTLPASVTGIGDRAFEATGVSDMWLPASVATVGERAFAACTSLSRVVALGAPQVAGSVLAECSGVDVYVPSESAGAWNVGLPAAGNHRLAYGVTLAEEPLRLEVGQAADLLEGGSLEAPEPIEASYSYAAKPLSVNPDGTAVGKAEGSSEVTVTLALDGVELVRASRTVEVAAAPEPEGEASGQVPETLAEPEADPAAERQSLEPRLSARGVEVLSGQVSLLAETRTFDYEYAGSNLRYQVTKEPSGDTPGTCTVMGRSYSVTDLEGNLVIPEIAVDAANGNAKYYVKRIENYAFGAMSIETVSFPQSLSGLGQGCFQSCPNLRSAVVPQSVSSMGFNPFVLCSVLSDLRVEEGSKYFTSQDGVLYNKAKTVLYGGTPASIVGQLDIPDTVTTVRVNSLSGCSKVTGLHIPKSVSNFGEGYNIIGGLNELKDLTVDPGNPYYAVEDGLLYKKQNGVPVSLFGGTLASSPAEPRIPATVTRLDKGAFRDRLNLQTIELPPSATFYGAYLFQRDANLSTVASLCSGTVTFDAVMFDQCSSLTELIVMSSDPVFANTEGGSGKRSQFENVDTRNVTLHCPESTRDVWAEFGLNVVPFSTGVPSVIGLPGDFGGSTRSFEPSISSDSAFAGKVRLIHTFEAGDSGIAADLSNPTGRSITFAPGSGSGSATLTTKLVYDSDLYGQVVLAESTSTVANAPRSGALPTATDAENKDEAKASWSLSDDGVLTVQGTEKIGDFGWTYGDEAAKTQHWGSLRDCVKKVNTRSLAGGASSMACWFSDMSRLSDVSDLVLPEGVEDVSNLLRNCAVAGLPEGFELPGSVQNADGLLALNPLKSLPDSFAASFSASENLASCRSMLERIDIERLPGGFALPSSASDVSYLFANSKLAELPEGFTVPVTASTADGLFQGCASLVRLPSEFALGEGVTSAIQMFDGCISLASLPEKLAVPASLSDSAKCAKMFGNCPKLQVLPAGFALPEGFDLAAAPDMFYCYINNKPLSYAGSDAALLGVSEQYWTDQGRVLDTTQAGSVVFRLLDASTGDSEVWTSSTPNVSSGIIVNPEAPHRTGKVFTLWYADEACTKRFDFTKRVADQLAVGPDGTYALYGAYVDGAREGSLPTVGNTGWASWSLSDDGALYIRGTGEIQSLGWNDYESANAGYWGPYRNDIKRAVTSPSVRGKNVAHWFYGCRNLTDIADFSMPAGVVNAGSMFQACSALKVVPEGFSLGEGAAEAPSMFAASGIVALPASFTLPKSLANAAGMFYRCASLASLPEGFAFANPDAKLSNVLRGCPSLASLPDGFSFPPDRASEAAAAGAPPFGCDVGPGGQRVATYYGGSDPAVLAYDWEAEGRTLVTDVGDMGEWGMRRVKFQVQSADGAAGFPWETRSVAWTDRQGVLADPGEPQMDGYRFSGWCTDEDCLEPVDFAQPLPAGVDALYGKWLIAGGRDAALPLATDSPAGTSAWWRITADGELRIVGDGKVGYLGWSGDAFEAGFWGPHRDNVRSVAMDSRLQVEDMSYWFAAMPNLTDVSKAFIPSSARNLDSLIKEAASLESLPAGFVPGEEVVTMAAAFAGCKALRTLPDGFKIPTTVTNTRWLFGGCYELEYLPSSLTLEGCNSLEIADSMFVDCIALKVLPAGFHIPEASVNVAKMFSGCKSLEFLPEGFEFANPAAVENVARMFYGCHSLISLPKSLKLQPLSDVAKTTWNEMFTASWGNVLLTRYDGNLSDMPDSSWWSSQYRELAASTPSSKVVLELMVPAESQDFELWGKLLVGQGQIVSIPESPRMEGKSFVGWCTDFTLENAFDFSSPISDDQVLYAKYAAKEGDLPTTDGGQNASWELDADGTLRIACEPGAIIKSLGWDPDNVSGSYEGTWNDQQWGFVRDEVRRIEMAPGVKAEDMVCWFAEMHNLVDVSGVYVPKDVEEINRLFFRCTSLEAIPDGFELPEGVVVASDAFAYCHNLKTLPGGFMLPSTLEVADNLLDQCESLKGIPASFSLPEGLQSARCMFGDCSSLESLPTGFTVPETVTDVQGMFVWCSSLKLLPAEFKIPSGATDVSDFLRECSSIESLPKDFAIPAEATNSARMFKNCTSLKSLPDGFAVPTTVTDARQMFYNCPSLTRLPATLDLAALPAEAKATAATMFWLPDDVGELLTVYAGSDLAKLGIDGTDAAAYWSKNFHRTLTTSAGKPDTVKEVSFVVADPSTGESKAWTTVAVGSGALSRPTDPSLFGYAFDGWYEDPSFSAASRLAFGEDGTAKVDRDMTLYGCYVLRVSYDIPVAAKVTIDASGGIEPAPVTFRSFTPKPLLLKSVATSEAPGAARLFPVEAERGGIEVLVGVGARVSRVPLGGSENYLGELPAAEPTVPGKAEGSLSFDRHGAQIDYQPGDDITSFAKLEWTVEVAS